MTLVALGNLDARNERYKKYLVFNCRNLRPSSAVEITIVRCHSGVGMCKH